MTPILALFQPQNFIVEEGWVNQRNLRIACTRSMPGTRTCRERTDQAPLSLRPPYMVALLQGFPLQTDRTKKTNATFRDPELFAISGRVGELTQPIVHLLVQVSAGRVAGMKGRSPHNLCPKLVSTRARDKNEPYFASTLCSSRGRSGPLPDSLSSLALFLRGMTLTRDKRRALSLPASVLLTAITAKIHGKYRNRVLCLK